MTTMRERLEDAFIRADGALEVAFRVWSRARARNSGPLMLAAAKRGRDAYRDMRRSVAQLNQHNSGE